MPKKTLFMGTTEVPAEQSAGSITSMLVQAGATKVSMKYLDRKIVGIEFYFQLGALEFPFEIPAKVSAIFDKLWAVRSPQYRTNRDKVNVLAQAERIAWRQLFRWVEAQCALIETGMVSNVQVFTPYMLVENGRTVFDLVMEQRFKALPAPENPV
jgi:hypothetical protein